MITNHHEGDSMSNDDTGLDTTNTTWSPGPVWTRWDAWRVGVIDHRGDVGLTWPPDNPDPYHPMSVAYDDGRAWGERYAKSDDTREAIALRLLHAAQDESCFCTDDLPEGVDVSKRYIYIASDNEGEWASFSTDDLSSTYAMARTDVYQDSKYAWWPMYVLDLDEQTHHKIEVVARITIGGVEG